jgi:protein SCO1/2
MSNHLRTFGIVALGLAAIWGISTLVVRAQGDVVGRHVMAATDIGGPFRLASAKGGYVDSKDLAGKPYGVFFGYTHCPDVCPTALYDMSANLEALGDGAKDFRLFFITVDPERDTVTLLKDYLSNFDPRIEALVPTPGELAAVAKAFGAIYKKVPTSGGDYDMNHTAIVYLMARDGHLASTIDMGEDESARMAKLRRLMAGS